MSAPIAFENAYALLTNIQGFNSFSLGPGSSTDEISRAFQTQSLIWHPDKNPGDPQALRIYNRMLRAYETLMDANTRRQHDARIAKGDVTEDAPGDESFDAVPQAPGAPKVPSPENQPPPEDLGAPPPSARPFAYVDKDPGPTTPAAKAGIRRGDALLRIGDASHLRDVQGQLQASLNQPLPVLVIDKKGRFMKKWVVPHSWDQWAPASLLGCQMSDQCPLDLQVSHPAVLAERARRADAARSRTMPAGGDDDSDGEDGDEEEIPVAPRGGKEVSRQAPPTACWARTLLALFSTLGVALGLVLLVWPLYHLQVLDIWGIRDYPCPANETIAANPIVVGPKGYGFDLIRAHEPRLLPCCPATLLPCCPARPHPCARAAAAAALLAATAALLAATAALLAATRVASTTRAPPRGSPPARGTRGSWSLGGLLTSRRAPPLTAAAAPPRRRLQRAHGVCGRVRDGLHLAARAHPGVLSAVLHARPLHDGLPLRRTALVGHARLRVGPVLRVQGEDARPRLRVLVLPRDVHCHPQARAHSGHGSGCRGRPLQAH